MSNMEDEATLNMDVPPARPAPSGDDIAEVARLGACFKALKAEVGKVIVGQEAVLEQLLIAIFARGHCLLVGVPGLAKTLMIKTVADALSLTFRRIQFTPDLMPADITGTEVVEQNRDTGEREFRFLPGPIFGNLILADEINRTPPKTQAALLEAMQERQVTVGGHLHELEAPFFVLATQNPIEQEGTYPLPEAQLDRFMFQVLVDYPDEEEEFNIVRATTSNVVPEVGKVLSGPEVIRLQRIVRQIPIDDGVLRYAMRLVRATRLDGKASKYVEDYVGFGAGPRASQFMVLAGKTRAALHGRHFVTAEDIRRVAAPVLRHRLLLTFKARTDKVTPDVLVKRLIETIPDESGALAKAPLSELVAGR